MNPKPGWYHHPHDNNLIAEWSGTQWTGATRPATPPPQQSGSESKNALPPQTQNPSHQTNTANADLHLLIKEVRKVKVWSTITALCMLFIIFIMVGSFLAIVWQAGAETDRQIRDAGKCLEGNYSWC